MRKFIAVFLILMLAMSASAELLAQEGEQTRPFWILSTTALNGYPEDDADNIAIRELTARTGVKFTIEAYNGDDYTTKLQLYIAGGNVPDMWYGSVDQVMEWKKQGLIIPLTELIEKYGQDMMPYMYESSLAAFTFDGEIWGLPSMYLFSEPGNEAISAGMVLREDWLNNLGLEPPETLDDLHDVLTAFTYNDPDKNGKDDTYGLCSNSAVLTGHSFNLVFNAFGITPAHWYNRDGVIVKGFMTEEFARAMEVLRDWYAEGLIDPEFPINSMDNVREKMINSKAGAYFSSAWDQDTAGVIEPSLKALVPEGNLMAYPPITGPDGAGGNPPSFGSWRTAVFSKTCENPELLMKFMNWFSLDVENWLLSENGIRGTHWDFDENGKFIRLNGYSLGPTLYAEGFCNTTRINCMTDRRYNTMDVINGIAAFNKRVLTNEYWGSVPAMNEYPNIEADMQATVIKVIQGEEPLEAIQAAQARYLANGGQEIQDQVNDVWQSMQ